VRRLPAEVNCQSVEVRRQFALVRRLSFDVFGVSDEVNGCFSEESVKNGGMTVCAYKAVVSIIYISKPMRIWDY